MKTISIIISILISFISFSLIGQTNKKIIVTQIPKTVPIGKKWILEGGKTTRVQVSYETLKSGSFCNALFHSNPRIASFIDCGDMYNAIGYIFFFKDAEKVPYTNNYTYDLSIISIIDKNFNLDDLQKNIPEKVGLKKVEFKAGDKVFVGNCLQSIELNEVNMTKAELLEVNKKENEANKIDQLKLSNFNIPIYSEKYNEHGTKPEIYDSKLKSIVFTCSTVMYKIPDKAKVDDVSIWTLTLNTNEFNLHSSNGIEKTYKLIKIEYDEQMSMQKFTLGNSDNKITHKLYIAWSNNGQYYSLILSSIDNSEEFQFQNVQSDYKQYQQKIIKNEYENQSKIKASKRK